MNVVLEGPDGAGKSTLAQFLAMHLGYQVHASEGPIRHRLDMTQRFLTYTLKRRTIFDRVAMISEPIYGNIFQRRQMTSHDWDMVRAFYEMRPVIVYCRGKATLDNHTETSATDTAQYVAQLKAFHPRIVQRYHDWAKVVKPAVTYEIGVPMAFVLDELKKLGIGADDAVAV